MLHRWRRRSQDEDPEFERDDFARRVFCQPDGTPTHPHLLADTFKKLVARSGLPTIRWHDLRHTHATLLLKAGVPIRVVSERLGHSTPGFTMATYQHIIPGLQPEAAQTFADLLEASTDLPASPLVEVPGEAVGDAVRPRNRRGL